MSLSLVTGVCVPRVSEAITLEQPGYLSALFTTLPPGSHSDLELDQAGNLYFPSGNAGLYSIYKVTPGGALSTWSNAPTIDLTLTPAGEGYAAGVLCPCIHAIQANGSYASLHADSLEWARVALTPDGTLYASKVGVDKGLYRIDRTTGQTSVVISGGPGPGGDGTYTGMASGADGNLYVLGWPDGALSDPRLFRLDASQLTPVATLPHGGGALALGPDGVFFVITTWDYGSGYPKGEVWTVDPVSGATALLVTSGSYFENPYPIFQGVGYDATSGTLYVEETSMIWAITKDETPIQTESWGALKNRYR